MHRSEVGNSERASKNDRPPAVAGLFYPEVKEELKAAIEGYLGQTVPIPLSDLRALICPHAGYIYSGPTAGVGYSVLAEQVKKGRAFDRVIVLAPAHRVAFSGIAIPDCRAFVTPLGRVPLWSGARDLAQRKPFLLDSRPHQEEHAVEVHLPFLQCILPHFELLPLVFGSPLSESPDDALVELANEHTLFIVSTDLSHYLPYAQARAVDSITLEHFKRMDPIAVSTAEACGRAPAATMLSVAQKLGWKIQLLDARNSGDTAGDKHRVVGYAALSLTS